MNTKNISTPHKLWQVIYRSLSLLLIGLCLYEAGRVIQARMTAADKFSSALNHPGGFNNIEDIPAEWIDILLRIEDPHFYAHKGIDMKTHGAGLTTITQSLTKRLFFKKFKPGFAKIEQSLIARFSVHPTVSKDDQLLAFFNTAYLGNCNGHELIGFRTASHCYFNKDFSELSQDEFIRLSAMLIGPNKYNSRSGEQALTDRMSRIQNLLAGQCTPQDNRDVYLKTCAQK